MEQELLASDVAISDAARREDYLAELRGASKNFGHIRALRGVTFRVRRGSVLALVGPSASGKSTLIKCLNLLHHLDAGELWYAGGLAERAVPLERPLSWRKLARSVLFGSNVQAPCRRETFVSPHSHRQRVGIVFQDFNLWPSRDVLANLIEGPVHAKGEAVGPAMERARALLDRFGLADIAHRFPHQLSGGQRQRVAIARALVMQPELLLLDEITSALDPELVADVLAMLRSLATTGLTMVLVTHHIEFARDVADHAVMIDHGEIVEEGPARAFFDAPQQPRTRRFLQTLRAAR